MSFFQPAFLGLLSSLLLILILSTRRRRYRPLAVSSLMLWEVAWREERRHSLLRRLLRNLALLLQLAAAAFLVLGLAGPRLAGGRLFPESRRAVLILDASASMQAPGPAGVRREEEARRRALEFLREHRGPVLLMEAAAGPRILSPFSGDRRRLEALVRGYAAGEEPGDIASALEAAFALAGPADLVVLVSDGAWDPPDLPGLARVRLVRVADEREGPARNAAITRFQFRRLHPRSDEYEILTGVANFSPQPAALQLELSMDGTPIHRQPLALQPGEERLLVSPYSGLIGGRAVLRLETQDDLEADNRAFLVFSARERIRVRLLSEGNLFLERLLAAYPRVDVVREPRPAGAGEIMGAEDILILDGVDLPLAGGAGTGAGGAPGAGPGAAEPLGEGNLLLIHTVVPGLPIEVLGRVEAPRVSGWDRDHPLLRGLDLSGVRIEEALRVRVPPEVKVLARSAETPLVCLYERPGLRALFIGFDLRRSDLPYRVAFPVLWANILSWLYPYSLEETAQQVQAGQPIEPPAGGGPLEVLRPDGRREELASGAGGGRPRYERTDRVGFYAVRAAGAGETGGAAGVDGRSASRETVYAVNLLSAAESDLRPRYPPPADRPAPAASSPSSPAAADGGGRAGVPPDAGRAGERETPGGGGPAAAVETGPGRLWRALVLLALALLAIEGVLFFRPEPRREAG